MDSKTLGNDFVPIRAGQASVLICIVELEHQILHDYGHFNNLLVILRSAD